MLPKRTEFCFQNKRNSASKTNAGNITFIVRISNTYNHPHISKPKFQKNIRYMLLPCIMSNFVKILPLVPDKISPECIFVFSLKSE